VNRSSFYSVLISQLSGFAGRELCKALKESMKVFCALSLNDAALIRQMFYVHTSWDQLPPMSRNYLSTVKSELNKNSTICVIYAVVALRQPR